MYLPGRDWAGRRGRSGKRDSGVRTVDTIRAISIIRSLANGVDPSTGAAMAMDSPCQQPETIRALFAATQALEREASGAGRGPAPRSAPAPEASEAWDEARDQKLCENFSGGTDIKDLARQHGCGGEEIQSRLEALGQVISSARERARQGSALETAEMDDFFVFRKPLHAATAEGAGLAEGASEEKTREEKTREEKTREEKTREEKTREDKALAVSGSVPQHD